MVGLIDPNPPPKRPERPPQQQQEKWWKGMFTNPIQVKRPAQGKYSPKVDERCVTWCSQTVRGRTEGSDPWCRSLCIRRVFEHEVRQLSSHFSQDAARHSIALASKERAMKFPLPPEGQRSFFGSNSGGEEEDEYGGRGGGGGGKGKERDSGVKFWEEGWYIWMTKNRWAAQERIDLMMLDLGKQTEWTRMKEMEERAWAERERHAQNSNGESSANGNGNSDSSADATSDEASFPLSRPLYPVTAEQSFLIRIPTSLPITAYARATLAPTYKLLGIVRESFENGGQRDLALRAWDVVREGTPFRLVKNVVKTCVESFTKGPRDEDS